MTNRCPSIRLLACVVCTAGLLGAAGCGTRPTEANQRHIVRLIEESDGEVYEFRYIPEHTRCRVAFTCWIVPPEGPARFYRGAYGIGRVDLTIMEPDDSP